MTFGQKLQLLRKEKGISQEKLADQLGVSRQAVSRWELDISLPETENIIKIRNIFSVSFDYLLGENITENGIANTGADSPAEGTRNTQNRPEKEYNKALYIFLIVMAVFSGVLVLRLAVPFIPVLVIFAQSGFDTGLMPTALANAVKFYTPSVVILMIICVLSLIAAVKIRAKNK